MSEPVTDIPALAEWLRSRTDDELSGVLRRRPVPTSTVKDFFDLAEELVTSESIDAALVHIPSETLAAIVGDSESSSANVNSGTLRDWALAIGDTTHPAVALSAVGARVRERRDELTQHTAPADAAEPTDDTTPAHAAQPADAAEPSNAADAAASVVGERVFSVVDDLAELLRLLSIEPQHETARGTLLVGIQRHVLEATGIETSERLDVLLELATLAGFTDASAGELRATTDARDWLQLPVTERWLDIASVWRDSLPPEVGADATDDVDGPWGDARAARLRARYPLGVAEVGVEFERARASAEVLGVLIDGRPTAAARAILRHDRHAAAELLKPAVPEPITGVYLQDDLTIIAPGPLPHEIADRLRSLAQVESRGLASGYRLTSESIDRALADGQDEEGIVAFLEQISLTGVPQPAAYLITEAVRRHALVQVSGRPDGGAAIASPDRSVLPQLLADHRLDRLGLRVAPGPVRALHTRFEAATVVSALADARYPATRYDTAGRVVPPRQISWAPSRTAAAGAIPQPSAGTSANAGTNASSTTSSSDPVTDLVGRLRTGSDAEPGHAREAWLVRQLTLLTRSHALVRLTVELPDRTAEFTLELTGVGGGRVRGRDRNADIERTLPLASIRDVQPA